MAGLFDLLNTVIGKITQNNVTYATAPTPPDGDNSTKVATTAFVKGSAPSGNVAVWSRSFTVSRPSTWVYRLHAPSGGTWFCWGAVQYGNYYKTTWDSNGSVFSGGAIMSELESGANESPYLISNNGMAIKIA